MGSLSTNTFQASKLLDPMNFSEESKSIVDFIYQNVEKYPVLSNVERGYLSRKLPSSAPASPESLEDIMQDIKESIIPGLTHWQSPNFFGYFPANVSTPAFLGEMLCSGLNVVCFNWITSPVATELESIVIDWLGQMLKLPSAFLFSGTGGGVLHGSTSEAAVCTLASARDRALKQLGGGWDNLAKMVVYASDQTHFTFQKAAKLVGIPPRNFRHVKTSFSKEFSMDPKDFLLVVEEDISMGLVPLYLCGTIGTTPSGAVDPLKELGEIAQKFGIWFHVDAAYAGSACICPEFQLYLDGIELADSFSLNPHKWFLTNLDCCCLWLKEPSYLVESLSTKPEILKNRATESMGVIDYKDWQIALCRRFKALKLWMVIRGYGSTNLMYHIRSDVEMAKQFEKLVTKDERFEVVVPRRFALVCFRLKPEREEEGGELNVKLLDAVNSSGRAFMTHAVLDAIFVIRCSIGATLTEERHIQEVWKLIQEKASLIIATHKTNHLII